jgi:hypothetical protein
MRRLICLVFTLILLSVSFGISPAFDLPKVSVDAYGRLETLFGSQTLNYYQDNGETSGGAKYDTRGLWLLSGTIEASPYEMISGRLVGATSVIEGRSSIDRHSLGNINGNLAEEKVTPDFTMWEAAGLLHVWNGGGYRFSFTGGYRAQNWSFSGSDNGRVDDEFKSQIPFVGMQTSMYFAPWWKARFEVLGFPATSKKVMTETNLGGDHRFARGNSDNAGLIEFQAEGTVFLTPAISVGGSLIYTHEEASGNATGKANFNVNDPGVSAFSMPANFFRMGLVLNATF